MGYRSNIDLVTKWSLSRTLRKEGFFIGGKYPVKKINSKLKWSKFCLSCKNPLPVLACMNKKYKNGVESIGNNIGSIFGELLFWGKNEKSCQSAYLRDRSRIFK